MPLTPVINATVNITAKGLDGNSISSVFSSVFNINIDYFKGMINIVDNVQGSFYFGISLVTTMTVTVAGNTHSIVVA